MLGVRMGRNHHDRDVARLVLALELAADGAPVLAGEEYVEDDQIRQAAVLVAQRLRVLALLARLHTVPLVLEEKLQRIEDGRIVVDDEDVGLASRHQPCSDRSATAPASPDGMTTRKTEPCPRALSTSIVPPWRRTISWEMNKPMPRPG